MVNFRNMLAEHSSKIIAGGLFACIVFTALAHGAVESWSVAIFELLILLLGALWMISFLFSKKIALKIPATFYPLAGFLLLCIVQCLPLTAGGESLSHDREATAGAVKILFFLLAAHLLAANFLDTPERQLQIAKYLIVFGFILAVFGILQYFTWDGHFFWLIPTGAASAGVIGPFVNHNHFAGFLELLIPLAVALILTGAIRHARLFYWFAAVIMSVALIASLSRGGMLSLVVGTAFAISASILFNRRWKRQSPRQSPLPAALSGKADRRRQLAGFVVVAVSCAAAIGGIIWLGPDPVVNRFADTELFSADPEAQTFTDSRGWIWANALKIFLAHPVAGAGLGAFETVYPLYSANDESTAIDRAHNDYLQVLSDTGLIGAIFLIWFFGALIYAAARSLRAPNPAVAAIAIGCAGAVFAMATHSIFDFNLQIPSNALLFLVLAAILSRISATVAEREIRPASEAALGESEDAGLVLGVSS